MYKFSPVSARVLKMRDKYRGTRPKICMARYKLITEFYMENPNITGILKRAKNFRNICEHIPVRIYDDEVIVGTATESYRGGQLYPEHSIDWILSEVRTGLISTRDADPYDISDEDRDYLLETGEFWLKECLSAKVDAYVPDGWHKHAGNCVNMLGAKGHATAPVGHYCTGYHNAINIGFGAIKAEADENVATLEENGISGNSIDQYNFYRAISIVCEGMITLTKRYALAAEEMARTESDPKRKEELLMMADTLNWAMDKPCRNYLDALQTLYMYQICMTLDGCMHAISFGRIDQYLRKFYDEDIAAGTLTHEYAQELFDMFFLKAASMNRLWSYGATKSTGGYTTNQLVTVGGVDKKGEDATCAVTYIILQTSARLKLHTPPVALRIHKTTPDNLWELAIETTKAVGGIPTFENDDIIIPALMSRGLPLESARNYVLIGCVEPSGCGDEWPACGGTGTATYLSLAGALLLGINDGFYTMPGRDGQPPPKERVGLATGYLYEMETFEQVLEAYKKQTEFFVKWYVNCTNSYEYVSRQEMPLPVVSATMDGCMEKGMDVTWGGARYNSTGMAGVGIGNVADSLYMIKHLCFDTKRCTTRELYDAIMADWEGFEDLHSYILNEAPHFGNADAEADQFACWASDVFADAANSGTGPRGRYSAGLYPVTVHVIYGEMTMATPDGRKKGEPLSDGISPVQQMDKNGPISLLLSVSNINQSKYPNGTLLNMRFHPTSLKGTEGVTKMRQLIETYFGMGGMQMQINVISTEVLRDAQKNPEEHKDMVVRVAGFSAYFIELYPTGQEDLIRRTELAM